MNKAAKITLGALAAGALASPATAKERTVPADLVLTEAMVPYVYQYAACVFGGEGATADERIAGCSDLKASLKASAKEPFTYWHRRKGPTRNRQFDRAFRLIDVESRILEKHFGPVPATVTSYMDCLGKSVAATDAFQAGRSISYVEFNLPCKDEAAFSFENAVDLERRLFQRVQRFGRVNRVPQSPIPAYELDRGLLAARYF